MKVFRVLVVLLSLVFVLGASGCKAKPHSHEECTDPSCTADHIAYNSDGERIVLECCDGCEGSGNLVCNQCNGSGSKTCIVCMGMGSRTCYSCGGLGSRYEYTYDFITGGYKYQYKMCYSCVGGRIVCSCAGGRVSCATTVGCGTCDGTGRVEQK